MQQVWDINKWFVNTVKQTLLENSNSVSVSFQGPDGIFLEASEWHFKGTKNKQNSVMKWEEKNPNIWKL